MSSPKQISLGLSMRYLGYHAAAWRHPSADPDAASKFSHYRYIAQAAEAAKMDMVFLADGIGLRTKDEPPGALCRSHQTLELEPLTLLSALSAVTSHIGLVSTAFAYLIFFRLLARAGATNVGLVTFLIPVSAILLGVLVLGETLATRHLAGMVLIGAGLILIDGRLVSALGAWFTAKEPAPRGNG